MTTLRENRLQKRFTGFLVTVGLLLVGLLFGNPDSFVVYAQMLAGAYSVYLGGQSWTDWQKAKNGSSA